MNQGCQWEHQESQSPMLSNMGFQDGTLRDPCLLSIWHFLKLICKVLSPCIISIALDSAALGPDRTPSSR